MEAVGCRASAYIAPGLLQEWKGEDWTRDLAMTIKEGESLRRLEEGDDGGATAALGPLSSEIEGGGHGVSGTQRGRAARG
jgi:hypothetical protein